MLKPPAVAGFFVCFCPLQPRVLQQIEQLSWLPEAEGQGHTMWESLNGCEEQGLPTADQRAGEEAGKLSGLLLIAAVKSLLSATLKP